MPCAGAQRSREYGVPNAVERDVLMSRDERVLKSTFHRCGRPLACLFHNI